MRVYSTTRFRSVQGRVEREHRGRVSSGPNQELVGVTRRRLLAGCTCGYCSLLESFSSYASTPSDTSTLSFRPRNGIRDRLFADAMNHMDVYEDAIREVKIGLFSTLRDTLDCSMKDGTYSIAEIGIGTGPNLEYYDPQKTLLQAVEPNNFMKSYLDENLRKWGFPAESVTYQNGFAEALPLESESQDAVVCTLLLCSVSDVDASLREFHRILKHGGSLLVIEHVVAGPQEGLLRVGQTLLNPLQRALADGCNLNRDTLKSIRNSGLFSGTDEIKRFSVPGLGVLSPHIAGIVTKEIL